MTFKEILATLSDAEAEHIVNALIGYSLSQYEQADGNISACERRLCVNAIAKTEAILDKFYPEGK